MRLKGKIKNGKLVLARRSRYGIRGVRVDNIWFDSARESQRYKELKLLQRAGDISRLHVHPTYDIVWPQTAKRLCVVELDFSYVDHNDVRRHEDVKGVTTALSALKRKLVEAAHGIKVEILR